MGQITRKDYIDGKVTHREYYGSIVRALGYVLRPSHYMVQKCVGATDPYYNHIPVSAWDQMGISFTKKIFTDHGDCITQSGLVCIKKEAVRQAVERIEKLLSKNP